MFHNFLSFCSSLYSYLSLFLLSLGTMFLAHFLSTSQFPLLSILLLTVSIVFFKMWQLHFLSETMLSWYWIFLLKHLPTISSEMSLNILITKTHIHPNFLFLFPFFGIAKSFHLVAFICLFFLHKNRNVTAVLKNLFCVMFSLKVADADPFSTLRSLCP